MELLFPRVRVNGNPEVATPPYGWGLSATFPADRNVYQLQMDLDISAGTVMTRYRGDVSEVDHLRYDVTNVGYYIRPDARVLVVGAGGGRDVLSALAFGARSVEAVEINRDVLNTVNGRFGDFTGHLDRDPRVRFVNDEARSYIARPRIEGRLPPDFADRHLGRDRRRRVRAQREFAVHARGLARVSRAPERRRRAQRLALVLPERTRRDVPAGGAGLGRASGRRRHAAARSSRHHPQHAPGQQAGGARRSRHAAARSSALYHGGARSPRCRLQDDGLRGRAQLARRHRRDLQPADLRRRFRLCRADYPINISPPTDDSPFLSSISFAWRTFST